MQTIPVGTVHVSPQKRFGGKKCTKNFGGAVERKKKEKAAWGCEKDFVCCHSREKEAIIQVMIFWLCSSSLI